MIGLSRVIAAWSIVLGTAALAEDFRKNDADYVVPVSANEIKIMNYNVENLFDAEHDDNKNDFEFLPKNNADKQAGCAKEHDQNRRKYCFSTDWTNPKILVKFEQIKKAIEGQGALPDVLTLEEVENPNVIGKLAKYLGYDAFNMTNSPDVRGIDVATLYKTDKLTLIDFKEYELKNPIALTRNLSVSHFRLSKSLGGGVLAVYPNHWPSQGTKTTKARLIPAEQLGKLISTNETKYKGEDYYVVVTGDFNTLAHESPNPVDEVLISAKTGLLDVATLSRAAGNPMHKKMPQATYYYGADNSWNEFDRLIISGNLNDDSGLDVDANSYRVNAPSFLCKKNDAGEAIPFRFNHNTTNPAFVGFADHFGVVVKLSYK
jgi:hypothetical protein